MCLSLSKVYIGPAHVQLSKVFWETVSELELSVFYLGPKHFQSPKTLYSITHEPAPSASTTNVQTYL